MKDGMKYLLIGFVVLLVWGLKDTTKKESVAAVEGQPCGVDADCPCLGWNTYNYSTTLPLENRSVIGVGVASCRETEKTCDMNWCYDIQPWGQWVKEEPWQWLKSNPLITLAIIGILILLLFGPSLKLISK